MAEPSTLTEITQEQYDAGERTVVDLIRSAYPTLDLRRGTVNRDVLLRPAATLYALDAQRMDWLRQRMSLETLRTSEDATPEEVNAILANFNMTLNQGAEARGLVYVKVDGRRTYTLASGFTFRTLTGLEYVTSQLYTIKIDANTSLGEVPLYAGVTDDYYYFVIPVVAKETGTQYNISEGTALDPVGTLHGFVAASAYSTFVDGVTSETIENAITRIPAAVSHRALTNRTAVEAQLRSRFDGTAVTIQSLSVQGYGDPAQRRDKHNIMGVAVGGRADIYVRTFDDLAITVLEKTGTRTGTGTYRFSLTAAEAPGFYAIRSVTDREGVAVGSYLYTESRSYEGLDDTWHDIDPNNGVLETAYTIFQNATVEVTGVLDTADTHVFRVELYTTPGLTELQAYVDDPDIRNVAADFLVRGPLVCLVSCSARVYYPAEAPVDLTALQRTLVSYINSRNFVSKLTRSELVTIMLTAGASRIELGTGGMVIEGRVRDALGNWYTLTGDALDIDTIASPTTLLTSDTCVFGAELSTIHLTGIPE